MTQGNKEASTESEDWPHVIPVGVPLLKSLGPIQAILLTILIEREKETARQDREYTVGGWFALSYCEISDITSFLKNRIADGLGELKREKYIESETRGIQHVQYYRVNHDLVFATKRNSIDLAGIISKSSRVGFPNSREMGNRSLNTKPNLDTNNPSLDTSTIDNHITNLDNTIRDSIHPEEGKPFRSKKINDVILPILQRAVSLGGFKNTFPEPGKAPTGCLLFAQKFLQSAFSGRLARDFQISNKEGQRGSLSRYLKESGRSLEEVLDEACINFNLLRGEDYGFPDKEKLPKDIGQFFYNPMTKFSWFISVVFNPPKPLASRMIEKGFRELPFTPKEREAIDSLRGKNWDPVIFKKKVIDLYAWYQANQEDLRVCAAYIDATNRWDQHFGSFKALCETIRDFAQNWDDWKPANFGYGNPTWARFVIKVREDHQGLDLSPPARKLAAAKIQWQRSQSGGLARDKELAAEHVAAEEQAEAFRKGLLEGEDEK